MGFVLALLLSVLTAAVTTALYATVVWWFDRYEREPLWLMSLAFVWGAAPAAIISLVAEGVFQIPVAALAGQATTLISTSLVAPFVEEVAKGAALVGIYLVFRSEFDDVLDGILYGTLIGFGFAMTENILYFMSAFSEHGWGAWVVTVFLRAIVFGFNHAFFTGITGAGIGYARLTPQFWKRVAVSGLALSIAISFHVMHNLFVSTGTAICFLSLFTDFVGVGAIFVLLLVAAWQEKRWVRKELAAEVEGGWLSMAEVEEVASYRRRLAARLKAFSRGGWSEMRRTGRWQQQMTELAFKKQLRRRRGDAGCRADRIEELRTVLAASRTVNRRV